MDAVWTTQLSHELTRPYGVEEIHNAWFLPNQWAGAGPTVSLLIPECETQLVVIADDGTPVAMVNRPRNNKNVKHWIRNACELAAQESAALALACDTAA